MSRRPTDDEVQWASDERVRVFLEAEVVRLQSMGMARHAQVGRLQECLAKMAAGRAAGDEGYGAPPTAGRARRSAPTRRTRGKRATLRLVPS